MLKTKVGRLIPSIVEMIHHRFTRCRQAPIAPMNQAHDPVDVTVHSCLCAGSRGTTGRSIAKHVVEGDPFFSKLVKVRAFNRFMTVKIEMFSQIVTDDVNDIGAYDGHVFF